jgi:hypothetical protein
VIDNIDNSTTSNSSIREVIMMAEKEGIRQRKWETYSREVDHKMREGEDQPEVVTRTTMMMSHSRSPNRDPSTKEVE